jgi:CDP-glucose 4,6-dehydratase
MINRSFWKNKRVFLTGHTGFKGSWMSMWLKDLGADIYGYSESPITQPSLFVTAKLSLKMTSTIGDIRDLKKLQEAINIANPDIVIHMAAQPLVRKSYSEPIETYSTNIMGTVNLLEAARACPNLKIILNVTTDKVYENTNRPAPYHENDKLGGFDPYSNSKACSELITSSYRSSFYENRKVKIVTARAGNVIGGGDWSEDRLVPDIIRAIHSDKKVYIRNPDSVRPWQHVLDSLAGYIKLTEYLYNLDEDYLPSWNIGPSSDDIMTVNDIVAFIETNLPHWGLQFEVKPSSLHEAQTLKLDVSQAQKNLALTSRWINKLALQNTFDWFEQFHAGKDAYAISMKQIQDYQE